MIHVLKCDKCGEKFETSCFGGGTGSTFYDPPMPKEVYGLGEFEQFVNDMFERKILAFCAEHAEEYRASL